MDARWIFARRMKIPSYVRCLSWGCDVAVILREVPDESGKKFYIVGRASVSSSRPRDLWFHFENELNLDVLSGFPPPKKGDAVNLMLAVTTLQRLTC
jgi:hypothetical protein